MPVHKCSVHAPYEGNVLHKGLQEYGDPASQSAGGADQLEQAGLRDSHQPTDTLIVVPRLREVPRTINQQKQK
eukprot:14512053-Alexandrium_andersonii.AAC.1